MTTIFFCLLGFAALLWHIVMEHAYFSSRLIDTGRRYIAWAKQAPDKKRVKGGQSRKHSARRGAKARTQIGNTLYASICTELRGTSGGFK
jgi:hypothetical protein